jgi:YD repeat-containing protein
MEERKNGAAENRRIQQTKKEMKNKIVTCACLMIIAINCLGQKKTDCQKSDLKGRVKSVTITIYNATEKFGEPVKTGIKEKTNVITIQFDIKGNIIPLTNEGNIVGYKYDGRGNKIEETTYTSDSTIVNKNVYKYDLKGNIIEEINYNSQGAQTSKETNTYDLNGNLLECKTSSNKFHGTIDQGQDVIKKYKYDPTGKTIEYSLNIGNSELAIEYYKYDNKGNIIELDAKTLKGYSAKNTYKYTFDAKENWVTRVCYSSSAYGSMKNRSEVNEITEHIIEYYKEAAQIEKEYKELISKAEDHVNSKKYSQAIDEYKESLITKNDPQIKERIINLQKLLMEEKYQNQISGADLEFKEKRYSAALAEYEKAFKIKDDQYARDKIKETQIKVDEIENAKKELEAKWKNCIAVADDLFSNKIFNDAIVNYQKAIDIKTDIYSQNQIVISKGLIKIDSLKQINNYEDAKFKCKELYSKFQTNAIKTELSELYTKCYKASLEKADLIAKDEKYLEAITELEKAKTNNNILPTSNEKSTIERQKQIISIMQSTNSEQLKKIYASYLEVYYELSKEATDYDFKWLSQIQDRIIYYRSADLKKTIKDLKKAKNYKEKGTIIYNLNSY